MANVTHLQSLIEQKARELTDAESRVADLLIESAEAAALYTAGELATLANTSDSTVIRLARRLGFSGYLEMQRAAKKSVVAALGNSTADRIHRAERSVSGETDLLSSALERDLENIISTSKKISRAVFRDLVAAIATSRRVYIVGSRTSSFVAGLLGFCLHLLREDVYVLAGNLDHDFDQLLGANSRDVILAISMARYSPHTLTIVKTAHGKGVQCYGITDSVVAPISEFSSKVLLVSNDSLSVIPSTAAAVSVINAIVLAVGLELSEEGVLRDRLAELEDLYKIMTSGA